MERCVLETGPRVLETGPRVLETDACIFETGACIFETAVPIFGMDVHGPFGIAWNAGALGSSLARQIPWILSRLKH